MRFKRSGLFKRMTPISLAMVMIVTSSFANAIVANAETKSAQIDASHVALKPEDGTTKGQPFASGTGGSQKFRIPCLVAMDDGTLVGSCDARWNGGGDAGGIDTIVSRSTDGGKTWNYTFANYLGDNGNNFNNESSCFIDPAMATDGKKIYMIADLYPAGYAINTAKYTAISGKSHDANGNILLADVREWPNCWDNRRSSADSYTYYLEKLGDNGSGYVIKSSNGNTLEEFTVDPFFNIQGPDVNTNLFLADSPFQVWPTDYLYLTTSEDNGVTWSEPYIINLRRDSEQSFLIGPGRGIVTSTGRLLFTAYEYTSGDRNSYAIYSDDDGKTWKRGAAAPSASSEAVPMEADGKLYMFTRHGGYYVSENYGETWSVRKETGFSYNHGCQLTGITYPKKIDGKTALLFIGPSSTSSRSAGKIYVALVNPDGTLEWRYNYSINGSAYYAYSCADVRPDGKVCLLYESAGTAITYIDLDIEDIAKGAVIGNVWLTDSNIPVANVTMASNATKELTVNGIADNAQVEVVSDDDSVTAAYSDGKVTLTSKQTDGMDRATITVTSDTEFVQLVVTVTDNEVNEAVDLCIGDIVELMDTTGNYAGATIEGLDSSIATVSLSGEDGKETKRISKAKLATAQANFNGETVQLESCMFTFETASNAENTETAENEEDAENTETAENEEGTENTETVEIGEAEFKIYAQVGGTKRYINHKGASSAGIITTTNETSIKLISREGGTFSLQDYQTGESYLYFHMDDESKLHFDRNSTDVDNCHLQLWKKSAQEDGDIPGYEQVTALADIKSGEKYLIVAKATDGVYYAAVPSTENTKHSQVAKVITKEVAADLEIEPAVVIGTDASFSNAVDKALSSALFTFDKVENQYKIYAQTESGSRVYIGPNFSSSAQIPLVTSDANIAITKDDSGFILNHSNKYVFFWSDNQSKLHFDRNSNVDESGRTGFEIYKKSASEAEGEIPGYEKINDISEIESGSQYLIAKKSENTYYLLYPSDGTDKYNYVAKVTNRMYEEEATGAYTRITIAGEAEGKTSVTIGNKSYFIFVKNSMENVSIRLGDTFDIPYEIKNESQISESGILTLEKSNNMHPYRSIDTIEEGTYLFGNSSHIMTTEAGSPDNSEKKGLRMKAASLSQEILPEDNMWTIAKLDDGYTMKSANGQYVNISGNNVELKTEAQKLAIKARNGSGFSVEAGGFYLNNWGNSNNVIAGWNNDDNDWRFYRPSAGSIGTAAAEGEIVVVTAGGVNYRIKVLSAKADIYTVNFETNGGSSIGSVNVEAGEKVSKPETDPTKTGYIFTGWYADAALHTQFDFSNSKITENITIYAGWRQEESTPGEEAGEEKNDVIVTYESNGGIFTEGTQQSFSVKSGSKLTAPATRPTNGSLVFSGWYKDEAGTQAWDFAADRVEEDMILYAGWGYPAGYESEAELSVVKVPDYTYTGKVIKPAVSLTYGGRELVQGVDYTVSYKNNVKPYTGVKDNNLVVKEDGSIDFSKVDAKKAPVIIIKGKKNYSSKATLQLNFNILPINLGTEDEMAAGVAADIADRYVANAKAAIKVKGTITYNKKKLAENKDYKLSLFKVVDGTETAISGKAEIPKGATGSYRVKVSGMGNYQGGFSKDIEVVASGATLQKASISLKKMKYDAVKDLEAMLLDGSNGKLTVKVGKDVLQHGKDYKITFTGEYIGGGIYPFTIEGIGNYAGSRRMANAEVEGISIKNAVYTLKKATVEYTGGHIGSNLKSVTVNGKTLTAGVDYYTVVTNDIKAGTVKVTINGKGIYGGTKNYSYKIEKKQITPSMIKDYKQNLGILDYYDGNPVQPKFELDYEGLKLTSPTDYTVSFKNNKKAGSTATATIKGNGNYTGTISVTFTIGENKINSSKSISKVKVKINDQIYTGREITLNEKDFATVTLKVGKDNKALRYGVDFVIVEDSYRGNVEVTKSTSITSDKAARVTIKGIGNYEGYKTVSFKIKQNDLKWWEALKNETTVSLNMTNYYTRAEADDIYVLRKDVQDLEVMGSEYALNSANGQSVDLSNYYTKAESDNRYALKSELEEYYTKTEVDDKFAFKGEFQGTENKQTLPESVEWLMPSDSLSDAISRGVKTVNLVNGQNYNGWQNITIDQPLTINGNGATVTFSDKSKHGWLITSDNVRLYNIDFQGGSAPSDAYNDYSDYWALKITQQMVTVEGCHFNKFIGAIGMVMPTSGMDEYYNSGANIVNNHIENCWVGCYRVGRYEFGRELNNRYFQCVIGVFDMAGNWTTVGSKMTACWIPYITADWVLKFSANGYNAQSSNNGHGTLIGVEFNHANNKAPYHTNKTIPMQNGSTKTLDHGMWLDGTNVIPPTMVGITAYYCDINIGQDVKGYSGNIIPIRMSDIVLSSCSVRNNSSQAKVILSQVVKWNNGVNLIGNVKEIDYAEAFNADSLNAEIQMLKEALISLGVDLPSWKEVTPELYKAFHNGSMNDEDKTFTINNDVNNGGIIFNENVTGVEFDMDSTSDEYATFGLVGAMGDEATAHILTFGWATANAQTREYWQRIDNTARFTNNSQGQTNSNIGWPSKFTLTRGCHFKAEKQADGKLHVWVTYPNGNPNANNYKELNNAVLDLPTEGTFRLGIVNATDCGKAGKLTNIRVYY